jgi:heptose I phosphotransferase
MVLQPKAPRESFWQRLVRGACRVRQRDDWQHFVGSDWVQRIMELPVTDRFHTKQGRSVGRLQLNTDAARDQETRLTVYLKRHHKLPWLDGLLATLFPWVGWSPAFQEWDHLEWARQQGIPVPRVVAAGEFIGPWSRLRSFLAVEELHGMWPLHEAIPMALAFLTPQDFRRWKRTLVIEIARLARLLHDRRIFHKDMYLCHFYITAADTRTVPGQRGQWRNRVHLIDLHRLTHHPITWRWYQVKDLAQLLYSTNVPGIDDRDRLTFWRAYRGPGPNRDTQGWLRRAVLFKWARYCRHNARHRPK